VYGAYFAASILFVHVADPLGESVFRRFAGRLTDIGGALAVVWFVYRVVRLIDVELERRAESPDSQVDDLQASIVGKTIRWVVVIIGAIVLIQNLTGVQAGPLIASLGIGGLAVALAAKESLSNMLGTATILFDKPFKIGERIEIEDYNGIVEQVGYRSTRLRTWDGHVVTLPNQKIITSALENVGIRPHIRWKTNITITYDTPPDKVDRAVEIIRDVIENQEGTDMNTPPWVFFNEFNDASLNIMVWAWYAPPELKAYHAWRMRNCRDIFRRFNEERIQFAFPTNTTYLANDDTRQLKVELLGARGPDGAPEEAAPLSA
jgi:MscS family membrane protein